MNHRKKNSGLLLAVVSCMSLGSAIASTFNCAFAQSNIVPDNSLGAESSTVVPNVNIESTPSEQINGGAIRGTNLFHSFREFNIDEERGAYFTNPAGIENIISRVTGGNISNIQGTLGVLGNANLFLINPSGIIFGPNASLDVNGSFVATTASSLKFADGTEFSAETPANTPLLTVSVPIGLQFGGNAGEIRNQSQITNSRGDRVGLQVSTGKTLALVGGDIALDGGNLTATEGRIELGSVAGVGEVSLNHTGNNLVLGYDKVSNFRDIRLEREAMVDLSGRGGGSLKIAARQLTLRDGAVVAAFTKGDGQGGTLEVTATEAVELIGTDRTGFPGGFLSDTLASGSAGNWKIQTGRLTLRDGARISTGTLRNSTGQGGRLDVIASESVELIGASARGLPSTLSTTTGGSGPAGELRIQTARLTIQNGAQVLAGSVPDRNSLDKTTGQGGALEVIASESVELIGISPVAVRRPREALRRNPPSTLSTTTEGTGDAGELRIQTRRLTLRDGAQISSQTYEQGQGGNLSVNASESVQLIGISATDGLPSGLFSSTFGAKRAGDLTIQTRQLTVQNGAQVAAGTFAGGSGGTLDVRASESVELTGVSTVELPIGRIPSGLFTESKDTGSAGNMKITTEQLIVRDGAKVDTNSVGEKFGSAGDLGIQASAIRLDNQGAILATTASGNGGNITLRDLNLLAIRRNSRISSTAGTGEAGGNGGNITIDAPNGFIVTTPRDNSDITANAFEGRGGFINITAREIFGIEPREQLTPLSDITAFSEKNPQLNGTVEINTPDVDPTRGLTTLPTEPREPQLAAGCSSPRANASSFIITGRGGLPDNPRESFEGNTPLVDWVTLNQDSGNNNPKVSDSSPQPEPEPIVEATGWRINDKGEVILIAEASARRHPVTDCGGKGTTRNSRMRG
jgi:filamentous hemagglutinin family protein